VQGPGSRGKGERDRKVTSCELRVHEVRVVNPEPETRNRFSNRFSG
jgi:hypothetical protein